MVKAMHSKIHTFSQRVDGIPRHGPGAHVVYELEARLPRPHILS